MYVFMLLIFCRSVWGMCSIPFILFFEAKNCTLWYWRKRKNAEHRNTPLMSTYIYVFSRLRNRYLFSQTFSLALHSTTEFFLQQLFYIVFNKTIAGIAGRRRRRSLLLKVLNSGAVFTRAETNPDFIESES